ncbi:MAG: (4Fe-4S)-binding protein [Lagierella massiliensis]|nr:(4Fe-4S)-binding protein [Lagierella massiliensis]
MKTYESEGLIIYWEPEKCEHAGFCVQGAPEVFDINRRPWIMPENATEEKIMEVIDRCPSKALRYELKK